MQRLRHPATAATPLSESLDAPTKHTPFFTPLPPGRQTSDQASPSTPPFRTPTRTPAAQPQLWASPDGGSAPRGHLLRQSQQLLERLQVASPPRAQAEPPQPQPQQRTGSSARRLQERRSPGEAAQRASPGDQASPETVVWASPLEESVRPTDSAGYSPADSSGHSPAQEPRRHQLSMHEGASAEDGRRLLFARPPSVEEQMAETHASLRAAVAALRPSPQQSEQLRRLRQGASARDNSRDDRRQY